MSSNDNVEREPSVTVRNDTGVVRVSIGPRGNEAQPVEQQPEEPRQSVRVAGGTVHMNPATGEMRTSEVQRVRVGGAADLSGASGILATARSPVFGGPVSEVKPNTIVRIEGYDVEVRTAVAMGYLRKTATGYEEVTKADQDAAEAAKAEAQRQQQEPQPDSAGNINKMTVTPFSTEAQQALDVIAEGVTEEQWSPLFAEYVRGKDDQRSLDNMAAHLNWTHEQAAAFVTTAEAAFRQQQYEVLAQAGVPDPAEFRIWCEENRVAEHDRAVTNQIVARSLEGFKLLVQEYVRTVTPSPEALRAAGYEVMKDPNSGHLLVKIEGVWQRAKAATRQGRL